MGVSSQTVAWVFWRDERKLRNEMIDKSTAFREDNDHSETAEQGNVYEIRFKGHLGERWASRFAEYELIRREDGTTLMVGPIADQSALYGLINRVRDLGLELISVNRARPRPNRPSEISCTTDI